MTGSSSTPAGPYLRSSVFFARPVLDAKTLIDASFASVSQSVSSISKSNPDMPATRARTSVVHEKGVHANPTMANRNQTLPATATADNMVHNASVLTIEPRYGIREPSGRGRLIECAAFPEIDASRYELCSSRVEAMWFGGPGVT